MAIILILLYSILFKSIHFFKLQKIGNHPTQSFLFESTYKLILFQAISFLIFLAASFIYIKISLILSGNDKKLTLKQMIPDFNSFKQFSSTYFVLILSSTVYILLVSQLLSFTYQKSQNLTLVFFLIYLFYAVLAFFLVKTSLASYFSIDQKKYAFKALEISLKKTPFWKLFVFVLIIAIGIIFIVTLLTLFLIHYMLLYILILAVFIFLFLIPFCFIGLAHAYHRFFKKA